MKEITSRVFFCETSFLTRGPTEMRRYALHIVFTYSVKIATARVRPRNSSAQVSVNIQFRKPAMLANDFV
jgi:hypothetical protein